MTNRELEIIGTAIKALLKFNALDEIEKIADLMIGNKNKKNETQSEIGNIPEATNSNN